MTSSTSFQLAAELTNRCNFSCVHCFRRNNLTQQPDLPLDLYEKFLTQSLSYHAGHITFTGGESLLHEHFDRIIELTVRHEYCFSLITNGWTFQEVFPLLLTYRDALQSVIFSLDGATAATHDALRQQPGSFQKVLQACTLCYYKEIPFKLTLTLNRSNIRELDENVDLAAKLGAAELNVGVAQLTPSLVSQRLALSPLERKSIRAKLLALENESDILQVRPLFDFFLENPCFPCQTMQLSTLVLDYQGRIRFCCQMETDCVGDLRTDSVWECHRQLVRRVSKFQEEKIRRIESNSLTEQEYFPCFYCARYFGQLDWLRDFPDSEWTI